MSYSKSPTPFNFSSIVLLLGGLLLLGACHERSLPNFLRFKNQEATEGIIRQPVARVYDNYLYEQDLEGLVDESSSAEDSANLVGRYIDTWVKKQLLLAEAASQMNIDEAEMERKILDYRYALIVYEFEKNYVNQEVDTEVSDRDIEQYYDEHKDNFELKQNIIKGIFAKVPQEAPRVGRLRNLFQGELDEEARAEIRSYCLSFASAYSLDDSTWYNFEEVIANTPLVSIPNKVQFLQKNEYVETSDDIYVYFVKVQEYKISDQISPLEFVKDDIVKIITNQRKVALTQQLEEDIYRDAKKNNEFEIFPPTSRSTPIPTDVSGQSANR
ncbi:MAG: peptidyl-prolyl cis-trans isomerase [Tunicatimonas sp.]